MRILAFKNNYGSTFIGIPINDLFEFLKMLRI